MTLMAEAGGAAMLRCCPLLLAFIVLLSSTVHGLDTAPTAVSGTVFYEGGKYRLQLGIVDTVHGAAGGTYDDRISVDGWGVLQVTSNRKFPDLVQMYAAGYLEGSLTAERIFQQYKNVNAALFHQSSPSAALLAFVKQQDEWTRDQIKGSWSQLTEYWQQVALIMAQFDGLVAGYQEHHSAGQDLEVFALQLLNGVGDFLDLIPATDPSKRPQWDSMTPQEVARHVALQGHCSALVKLTGDYDELYAAHSSWFTYGAMLRIFKHYNFDLASTFVAARKMSFSSYPGFLESLDDFYMMPDSGLVMLQTTNSIFNQSLYDMVKPSSLFAWQRVRLANSMAKSGKEWSQLLAKHNSGTYNNQYMVIDYKEFKAGELLGPNILWVVEQIPGLVEYADVSNQLERGYWPSYNVPYFESVYNLSGYPEFVSKHGLGYSYQLAPRAQIFRRDQGKVTDLDSFKHIMRYNDYKNDPYSKGNPGNAICSRFDLEAEHPSAGGCYDTKVTNSKMFWTSASEAISGPTTNYGLPPFQWDQQFQNVSHTGQPQVFDFDFVPMKPNW